MAHRLSAVGLAATPAVEERNEPLCAALLEVAEMSLAKANRQLAEEFLLLGGRPDVSEEEAAWRGGLLVAVSSVAAGPQNTNRWRSPSPGRGHIGDSPEAALHH